jgi:hypothetical protein
MARPDPAGALVIDDFQAQPSLALSSSGGAVSTDLTDLVEAALDDPDADFAYVAGQAMNGMTYGGPADATRGASFSFSADRFLAFDLFGGPLDARGFDHVSLRVGQEPRDPLTVAALGDVTFTLVLEDAAGVQVGVGVGVLGAGAPEPYQRAGCGAGVGWLTELATVRVRLDAFRGVDLAALKRVTLRFGPSWGSAVGRLALDELELVRDE